MPDSRRSPMTSFRSLFGSIIPSKGRSVVARSNRLDGDGIAVSSKIVGANGGGSSTTDSSNGGGDGCADGGMVDDVGGTRGLFFSGCFFWGGFFDGGASIKFFFWLVELDRAVVVFFDLVDLVGGGDGVDPLFDGGRRVRGPIDFPLAIASISSSLVLGWDRPRVRVGMMEDLWKEEEIRYKKESMVSIIERI
jgi:hypothetical protein